MPFLISIGLFACPRRRLYFLVYEKRLPKEIRYHTCKICDIVRTYKRRMNFFAGKRIHNFKLTLAAMNSVLLQCMCAPFIFMHYIISEGGGGGDVLHEVHRSTEE